jgi:hypothetical protein
LAGYIMNMDSIDSIEECILRGSYSTRINIPDDNKWRVNHEGTFADYTTMKPGDNIYFFHKRKIYGIGELVSIDMDCKYKNFPEANEPRHFDYAAIRNLLLYDAGQESDNFRWVCFFKPSPYFFQNGVDMDDVLSSNPAKFKMLRAFWKLSFVKIDDDENQALHDVILKFNQNSLQGNNAGTIYPSNYQTNHARVLSQVNNGRYNFDMSYILSRCSRGTFINHEMALEACLLFQLANRNAATINIFGNYDYLSHQVIASPFKPIDYMDRMDVFGYSYITGFKTKSKYIIAELKKNTATLQDLEQLMKYVDFVNSEYAFNDYSMIKAFLVAYNFSDDTIDALPEICNRRFIFGHRPAESRLWNDAHLVRYEYNSNNDVIDFISVI